jgi:hypothetical protein
MLSKLGQQYSWLTKGYCCLLLLVSIFAASRVNVERQLGGENITDVSLQENITANHVNKSSLMVILCKPKLIIDTSIYLRQDGSRAGIFSVNEIVSGNAARNVSRFWRYSSTGYHGICEFIWLHHNKGVYVKVISWKQRIGIVSALVLPKTIAELEPFNERIGEIRPSSAQFGFDSRSERRRMADIVETEVDSGAGSVAIKSEWSSKTDLYGNPWPLRKFQFSRSSIGGGLCGIGRLLQEWQLVSHYLPLRARE